MLLFCISIGAVPFSKLSCVSMCTFMHAHTYTSTSIHLQLQSHVCVNLCFLTLAIRSSCYLFKHMHAHAHTDTHTHTLTQTHMHVHAHSCTRTGVMLQSQTCAYVHIKMACTQVMALAVLSEWLSRAITALKKCNWQCKNGLSYSGFASYYNNVPEWFVHFQVQYLSAMYNGLSHSGLTSCTLLVCKNGWNHSGTANKI